MCIIALAFLNGTSFGQVNDIQLYKFAHSLIDHRPPAIATPSDETTIAHWIYDIAQFTGKTFATTGQFGQLANHVDNLPPNSNLGYDNPTYSWNEEESSFSESPLNTILLTAANFIQYSDPSEPDPADPQGRTVIELTETIFDWTNSQKPDMRYYIYGNWPEMDLMNAYPPNLPNPSEVNEFHDITIGNIGFFADWWLSYHDQILASRPELNTKLIPVGMIISKLLTEVLANQIPFEELYEDSAPHGRANIYFLAGMITYMALYEENLPNDYTPSDIINVAIRSNIESISNFAWSELNKFNFSTGGSRVFYSNTINNNHSVLEKNNFISIHPNPTSDYFTLTYSASKHYTCQIKGMDGKLYANLQSDNNSINIDLTHMPKGFYLIEIGDKENGRSLVEKLIKK